METLRNKIAIGLFAMGAAGMVGGMTGSVYCVAKQWGLSRSPEMSEVLTSQSEIARINTLEKELSYADEKYSINYPSSLSEDLRNLVQVKQSEDKTLREQPAIKNKLEQMAGYSSLTDKFMSTAMLCSIPFLCGMINAGFRNRKK